MNKTDMRKKLPYGIIHLAEGGKILFNRDYEYINCDVKYDDDWNNDIAYFYDDSNPPWNDVATYQRCLYALGHFPTIYNRKGVSKMSVFNHW